MPPAGVTAAAARLGDAAQVGDFFLAAGFELAHHVLKRHFTLRLRLSAGLPGAAGIRALGARGRGSVRLMESAILPSGEMIITFTFTVCPSHQNVGKLLDILVGHLGNVYHAGLAAGKATNAPNFFTPVILPSTMLPTSTAMDCDNSLR